MYRAHHARMSDIETDVFAYERAMGEHIDCRAFTLTSEASHMRNVKLDVTGTARAKNLKLIITVDLMAERSDSKSGKSAIVASTEGNVPVPGMADMKLGLNVYETK